MRSTRALAAVAGAAIVSASGASALQLQRLHVTTFTLTADVSRAQLERPFHLTVAIHVSEDVAQLQNVELPDFFGAEELGDEHHTIAGPGGTDYREVLTLVAHQSGTLHFTPATLAAIDARDGMPKRFLSNALTLAVGGGVAGLQNTASRAGAVILRLILLGIVIAVAIAFVRVVLTR
ncbi:MAG: hypothetical protein ACREP1_05025, partial [Rhodanobacteraceae bacterium]